jgi:nucleoside-diphosphate-sugar epimerase
MKSAVILGCGYSGLRIARQFSQAGVRVVGTTRDPMRGDEITAFGAQLIVWTGGAPTAELAKALRSADAVVASAPPRAPDGDPTLGAAVAIEAQSAVVYLSTTGVYGDLRGGWAFEWTPAAPASPEGEMRLSAEAAWRTATGGRAMAVRLPGIYGPGRSPLDRVSAPDARRVIKAGQVFSRIHVEDLASGVIALLQRPLPGAIFNLTDDMPASPEAPLEHAAALLGIAPPPAVAFEDADLSPMARRFYADSKRVSNARLKAWTGWRPRYPDYQAGLAAVLASD